MSHSSEPMMPRHDFAEGEESAISVSHIVRVLRRYFSVILLTMTAAAILYLIVAVAVYLIAPSVRTTSLQFRMNFDLSDGKYPNKLKFAPTDIVATPVLLYVYQANELDRFMPFDRFARSVTVLESNPEYEKLATRYRARLSDKNLSLVDRERIEKEFDQALASISKHGYVLLYVHTQGTRPPEKVIRKVLVDVLSRWADVAVNQQHVLSVDRTILSPRLVDEPALRSGNLVTGIQVLRSRVLRINENLTDLETLPGAYLARTPDQLSLGEIQTRVEEIVRFRLEPLVASLRPNALQDGTSTIQMLRDQLAYDERQLQAAQQRAESVRQTLAVYAREENSLSPAAPMRTTSPEKPESETVMPQLSDTFLDRLVALTSQSGDVKYRQELAEDYREALREAIPLAEAVAYDRQVLEQIQSPGAGGRDAASVRAELAAIQSELHTLVEKMNELYQIISRTLYPTTQLATITEPPVSRVERSINPVNLALYGVLTVLVAFFVTIVGVLIHNRMREEEAEEEVAHVPADGTV